MLTLEICVIEKLSRAAFGLGLEAWQQSPRMETPNRFSHKMWQNWHAVFLEGDIVAHLAVLITSKEARVNSKRFAERCWEHPFSGIWDRTYFLTNYTWSLRVLCFGAFLITQFSIGWSCKLQEAPNVKYLTNCCCVSSKCFAVFGLQPWRSRTLPYGRLCELHGSGFTDPQHSLLYCKVLLAAVAVQMRRSCFKRRGCHLPLRCAPGCFSLAESSGPVIESILVRPIMHSRPRFFATVGFIQVLYFLTNNDHTAENLVVACWSGILNLSFCWPCFFIENPGDFPCNGKAWDPRHYHPPGSLLLVLPIPLET